MSKKKKKKKGTVSSGSSSYCRPSLLESLGPFLYGIWMLLWSIFGGVSLYFLRTNHTIGLVPFCILSLIMLAAGAFFPSVRRWLKKGRKGISYEEYRRQRDSSTPDGQRPQKPYWLRTRGGQNMLIFMLLPFIIAGVCLLLFINILSGMGLTIDVMTLVFPNRAMGTVKEARYSGVTYDHSLNSSVSRNKFGDIYYKIEFDQETAGETQYEYHGSNQFAAKKQEGSRQLVLFFDRDRVYDLDLWKIVTAHIALATELLLFVAFIFLRKPFYAAYYQLELLNDWTRPEYTSLSEYLKTRM